MPTEKKKLDPVPEREAKILKVLRTAVPRIIALELAGDDHLKAIITVPKDSDQLPVDAPADQRQFYREMGLTKVEKATLDFLGTGELRPIAGGELLIEPRFASSGSKAAS